MTANEKMDAVLQSMNMKYDRLVASHSNAYINRIEMLTVIKFRGKENITWDEYVENEQVKELDLILKYLEDKSMISSRVNENLSLLDNKEYCITWKGKVFIENGGFDAKSIQKNLEGRRVQISHALTWILAVGVVPASVYYLIEILKHTPNGINIQSLTAFFLLLAGMAMGIIIAQLLRPKDK